MNKQRVVIIILSILGSVATFMPWAKAPIVGTVYGTAGDGWITLALFAVAIVICFLSNISKSLQGGALYGAIIPPLFAGLIGLWKIVDFNSKMAALRDNPFTKAFEASISIEYGLYIIVLAGLLVPVMAFLFRDKVLQVAE